MDIDAILERTIEAPAGTPGRLDALKIIMDLNECQQNNQYMEQGMTTGSATTGLGNANPPEPMATANYTPGQIVMSVTFNPGQREDVAAIKQIFAEAFDEIEKQMAAKIAKDPAADHGAAKRLAAVAKTELEGAQMWAVKAITR